MHFFISLLNIYMLDYALYMFIMFPLLFYSIPRYTRALFLHVHFYYLCYLSLWPQPGLTGGLCYPALWALKRLITWAYWRYLRVARGNVTLPCFCCFRSTFDPRNHLSLPPSFLSSSWQYIHCIPLSPSFFTLNSPPSSVIGEVDQDLLHHAV